MSIVAAGCGSGSDGDSRLQGEIQIDGSSTVYPITEAVAEGRGKAQARIWRAEWAGSAFDERIPVLATLSGTYSNIVASTPIIAESGAPGGSLTSATIVLANGKLTQYDIAATDALARNWTGSCASCGGGVSLANFRDSGIALSGTGPNGGANGKANGQAVGPTGKGVISAFSLQDSAAAITGSFAVTK